MSEYKRIITNSELRAFKECPQKWFYRYQTGWRPVATSERLFEGTVVHGALELHYKGYSSGRIMSYIMEAFRDAYRDDAEYQAAMPTKRKLMQVVASYINNNQTNDFVPAKDPITGEPMIEYEGMIPVYTPSGRASTKYQFAFKVDLVGTIPGKRGFWVIDHKTTKTTITDRDFERLPIDQQMRNYCYAVAVYTGLPIRGAVYNKICITPPALPTINKDGTISVRKANYDADVLCDHLIKQDQYLCELPEDVRKVKKLASGIDFDKYADLVRRCAALRFSGFDYYEFSKADMKEAQMEIYQTTRNMAATKWYCKNDSACDHFAGCPYRSICMGLALDGQFEIAPRHVELNKPIELFHSSIGKSFVVSADELQRNQVHDMQDIMEVVNA